MIADMAHKLSMTWILLSGGEGDSPGKFPCDRSIRSIVGSADTAAQKPSLKEHLSSLTTGATKFFPRCQLALMSSSHRTDSHPPKSAPLFNQLLRGRHQFTRFPTRRQGWRRDKGFVGPSHRGWENRRNPCYTTAGRMREGRNQLWRSLWRRRKC